MQILSKVYIAQLSKSTRLVMIVYNAEQSDQDTFEENKRQVSALRHNICAVERWREGRRGEWSGAMSVKEWGLDCLTAPCA
jgi:hypothetical protein